MRAYAHAMDSCTSDVTGQKMRWGQEACGAALRVGDYKLVVGYSVSGRRHESAGAPERVGGGTPAPALLLQSGDGPGPDGCNYTTGKGCPCHHAT